MKVWNRAVSRAEISEAISDEWKGRAPTDMQKRRLRICAQFGAQRRLPLLAARSFADPIVMTQITGKLDALQQFVAAASARHQALSQNIANVNTPGYHRVDIRFDNVLAAEAARGSQRKPIDAPELVREEVPPERSDENNVDIDHEMGELNRNKLLHDTWVQLIGAEMGMLRKAIEG